MSLRSMLSEHTATIQVEVKSTGAAMGKTTIWSAIRSNAPCRVNPLDATQVAALRKEGLRGTHDVYFYYNPQVSTKHRIVWVDGEGVTHYLYVRGTRNPHGLGRYWKIQCEEMRDVHNTGA